MRKLPILPIFLTGLLLGILMMNFCKSTLLNDTGLLNEYTLYCMKNTDVNNSALFYFVLKERLGMVVVLVIMATTYLGIWVCGGLTFFMGTATGLYFSAAIIRYGMKGIFLVLACSFPHDLLYVPGLVGLILWCNRIWELIYYGKSFPLVKNRTEGIAGRIITTLGGMGSILQLGLIIAIFIMGCLLESYVAPYLFLSFLEKF